MKLLRTIGPGSLSAEAIANLKLRQAARAVVFDDDKNVALLHVQKDGYYKLPGGGIEKGEDILTALKRECLEEIGCDIEVDQELGKVIEYREQYQMKQESYCFIAHTIGAKGLPNFSEKELRDNFKAIWVPLQEAIRLASESNTEE
ncbi:NUDIX domain-containing protein [Patescibacteria group bacterium]|nr:NUDIX domain-containing protein [Patescibacteria group bacterium]